MMRHLAPPIALVFLTACAQAPYDPTDTRVPRPDSLIQGAPAFAPDGCRLAPTRICEIGVELRFTPPTNRALTWASKPFVAPVTPDGTTDGASIPAAVWGLIGLPYDPLFVRPAILHDHYTYDENLVRPWQDTHRMFYYALLEEGVDPIIAQVMFYAVYAFGGHWTDVLKGEDCGLGCAQFALRGSGQLIYYPPTLDTDEAAVEIRAVYESLQADALVDDGVQTFGAENQLLRLERLAQSRNPANIPFIGGGIATLSSQTGDSYAADIASGRARVIAAPVTD